MDQSVLSRGAWATVLQNSGIMSILGDPEFQNPEFQAATVESGVDKDAENHQYFDKERIFWRRRLISSLEKRLFS